MHMCQVSDDTDKQLAAHVLSVHRTGAPPKRDNGETVAPEVLRAFIAQAKSYEPHVPPELTGGTLFLLLLS